MTITERVTAYIAAVCPIHGDSIGRKDDKNTWRIDYKPEATQAQKDAALAALNGIDIAAAESDIAKKNQIVDLETQYPVTQRFLREALIEVAKQFPQVKSSPGYIKIAEGENKIKALR